VKGRKLKKGKLASFVDDEEAPVVVYEDEAAIRYRPASKERQAHVLDVLAEFVAKRLVKKDDA